MCEIGYKGTNCSQGKNCKWMYFHFLILNKQLWLYIY
jgi:hypothetical protein